MAGEFKMNSEVIEVSRRLEECADWHDSMAIICRARAEPNNGDVHEQWAADIRSIIMPQPGEKDVSTKS